MAKALTSVIGVDIGRYSLKSVLLQKKGGNRVVISNYASRPLAEPIDSSEALARELKLLFKEMGGVARYCAVGVSSPEALIRIIEQPETPVELLREALRLNGMVLLNQDCREFVLDCDRIPTSDTSAAAIGLNYRRYLVGGLPRAQVSLVGTAVEGTGSDVASLQIAPICAFNAFEFAHEEIFNKQAFFLVDVGHTNSTVMVGVKRELILVRSIDFGGKALIEALMALSGEGRDGVIQALDQEDEVIIEYTRVAFNALIREIQNSIGFLEHRHEETISKIFISGGIAKSGTLLKVLAEELRLPCESWSAVSKCESTLPPDRTATLSQDILDLNVACGAATGILQSN